MQFRSFIIRVPYTNNLMHNVHPCEEVATSGP